MKHPLFSRVALAVDLPAEGMRGGDVATVVEWHPAPTPTDEPGYSVEVFSAVGETVAVLTVPESHLERLRSRPGSLARCFEIEACTPRPGKTRV